MGASSLLPPTPRTWFRTKSKSAVWSSWPSVLTTPGIVAISGSGSIVLGVTAAGRQLRNYDFHHYAPSTARHLAYGAVFRIIAGETEAADRDFVQEVLTYWGAADLPALAEIGARGFLADTRERNYRFGSMATCVTEAAAHGVPLARAVCDRAAAALGTGIRLVGSGFPAETVLVALVGSVIRSPYLKQAVEVEIARSANRQYSVVEPVFSSVQGAVLMALEGCGTAVDDALARTLDESTQAAAPAPTRSAVLDANRF